MAHLGMDLGLVSQLTDRGAPLRYTAEHHVEVIGAAPLSSAARRWRRASSTTPELAIRKE
jgi:hypothetical protein